MDYFDEGATARAEALLVRHLSPEQWHTWTKGGYIYVVGNYSKTKYKIFKPRSEDYHQIWASVIDQTYHYCAYTLDVGASYPQMEGRYHVPYQDDILLKKLLLETDEVRFLNIAVRTLHYRNHNYPYP